MSSKAALVNEKHYQVKLILEMLNTQDKNNASYSAQKTAVEVSAVLLMQSAFHLFLAEVADSCQLKQGFTSIEVLHQALEAEERSHAVVETLMILEHDGQSWLANLLAAVERVSSGLPVNKVNQTTTALQFIDVSESVDVVDMLGGFISFVQQQRSFLSEW